MELSIAEKVGRYFGSWLLANFSTISEEGVPGWDYLLVTPLRSSRLHCVSVSSFADNGNATVRM